MLKITLMKQQRKMILLIHIKKLLQLIHWPKMELPYLRIVMMVLPTLAVFYRDLFYHLPTYPLPMLSVSHRNDLTGS